MILFKHDRADLEKVKKGPVKDIWDRVIALYDLIKDSNASKVAKVLAITALIYLLSPVDLVPDFIPGGFIDDVGVILSVIASIGVEIEKYLKKKNNSLK